MHIERYETFLVRLPAIRPHRLANQTVTTQTLVILRLTTSDGITGVGEATTIGGLSYGAESPEAIKSALDIYIRPLVENVKASYAEIRRNVNRNIIDSWLAKSALDTALLDIEGKRLGVPVHTLLGGCVHKNLEVIWGLATGDVNADIDEAEKMLAEGRHQHFKIKVGAQSVTSDVKRVSAIAQALEGRASIRVDANRAWSEIEAREAIRGLADAGVSLVEQPVDNGPFPDALQRLMDWSPIPIMADESVATPKDALMLAKPKSCDVFALKIGKSGGPSSIRNIAAIASAAGVELYGGTLLEGAIGSLASAHAFAALPCDFPYETELFGPLLLQDDITTNRPIYQDFNLLIPNEPGLGVTIDEDKLKYYSQENITGLHTVSSSGASAS